MLAKVCLDPDGLESASAEELADTLYEIGRTQSQKLHWSEAIYWLNSAHDAIAGQTLENLSSDAEELRISIMHEMARALISQGSEENRARAWDIILKLDVECGNRLVVLLLKLDILAMDPVHALQDYSKVLQTIVRSVHLTASNIKTVLYHVHKLRARSPPLAHTALVALFLERLLGAEQPEWLERTFVTIIWNCTTSNDFLEIPSLLGELLETLASTSIKALSASATHAAQIVRLGQALQCSC